MQTIDKFNENIGTAILLIGPPGGGKTVLGCRLFPKTYVIVADLNFSSGLRYLKQTDAISNVVGFDTIGIDEAGKKVPVAQRYDRMWTCLTAAVKDPVIDTIFVDSITLVEDYIKAKICNAPSESMIKLEGFPAWGSYLITWKGLILQLRESGKKIIFSGHEEYEMDKLAGYARYGIMVDGKIKGKFGGLFSDVWRCFVKESNGKHEWQVQVLGNASHELKNNYGWNEGLLSPDEVIKRVRKL